MKIAGGIIAIVAGALSAIMVRVTPFIRDLGGALELEYPATVFGSGWIVGSGWFDLFLSFVVIALGVATITAKKRLAPILLLICAVIAFIAAGIWVAIYMVLAMLGALLALFDPSFKTAGGTA